MEIFKIGVVIEKQVKLNHNNNDKHNNNIKKVTLK